MKQQIMNLHFHLVAMGEYKVAERIFSLLKKGFLVINQEEDDLNIILSDIMNGHFFNQGIYKVFRLF